jgi:small-conductance mechanosensitive channel
MILAAGINSMQNLWRQIVSLPLIAKLISAGFGVLLIHGAFRLLERTLPRFSERPDVRYRVRKFVVFAGYVIGILFIALLFEDRLMRLSFALGVAGAGVAVALQDVIASIAGWFGIGFSHLYTIGDRIQIGEIKGDVIDISILRTTVMETGNWVSRDLYNGRVVRIPNNSVIKGPVFNYSQGFRFVWDEIKVPLKAGSDRILAKEMLLRVANEAVANYLMDAEKSWKDITDNYKIENPRLQPTVTLVVNSGSLEFTVSYIVDYTKRTTMKDQLFTTIVDEIAKSNGQLDWASSSFTLVMDSASADLATRSPMAATGAAGRSTIARVAG